MTNHRKLLFQMSAIFMALPILYIASSGPVIRYGSLSFHHNTWLPAEWSSASPAPTRAVSRSMTEKYFPVTKESYPTDDPSLLRRDYAQEFYGPLVHAAEVLHLIEPLSRYLHLWGVFLLRTKNSVSFLVFDNL